LIRSSSRLKRIWRSCASRCQSFFNFRQRIARSLPRRCRLWAKM
jgi:hypothetical protein